MSQLIIQFSFSHFPPHPTHPHPPPKKNAKDNVIYYFYVGGRHFSGGVTTSIPTRDPDSEDVSFPCLSLYLVYISLSVSTT